MQEPTLKDLQNALRISRLIGETTDLRRLREMKTTWFGSSENELRQKIDKFLRKQ